MIIVLASVAFVYFVIGILLLIIRKEESTWGPYPIPMSMAERFIFFLFWLPILLFELFFE